MEIIKNSINNNEIIKWEKFQVINYRKKLIQTFIISVFLVGGLMTLIGLFFWYVPSWGGTFYIPGTEIVIHPLIIYISILSIFISMGIFAITFAIYLFKRGLRRLELKLSDLRSYPQIHVLTNKRWIQKDYRSLVYFGDIKSPHEAISRTKDFVFIYLNNIEKATVSRIRSTYNISFHFKKIFSLNQYPTFSVKFKLNDFQELKSLLAQILPLEILKE